MNSKTKIFGLIGVIYSVIFVIIALTSVIPGLPTSSSIIENVGGFAKLYLYLLIAVLIFSVLTYKIRQAAYLEYLAIFLGYVIGVVSLFPDLTERLELGFISFILQAPIAVFLLFQLLKFDDWGTLRIKRILPGRWAFFRFWISAAALSIFIIGFILLLTPDYKDYGRIIIIPGLYFIAPFYMYIIGKASIEVIAEDDPIKTPTALQLTLFILIAFSSTIFLFHTDGFIKVLLSSMLFVFQMVELIYIWNKKEIFRDFYEHFFENNPLRPYKNWFNKLITSSFIVLFLVISVIYITIIGLVSLEIIPIPEWSEYIEFLGLEISASPTRDPLIILYLHAGIITGFINKFIYYERKNANI